MAGFLIIVVLLAAFWFVAVLPRRRRMQAHQAMQDALEPGDDVITAGGLHGRILQADGPELRLEIAPAVVVTVDRRAVAAVATDSHPEPQELEEDAESAEIPQEATEKPR